VRKDPESELITQHKEDYSEKSNVFVSSYQQEAEIDEYFHEEVWSGDEIKPTSTGHDMFHSDHITFVIASE